MRAAGASLQSAEQAKHRREVSRPDSLASTSSGAAAPPSHAARHTYDHASRKWDNFDVDAALAEVMEEACTEPAAQQAPEVMSEVATSRTQPDRQLPPVRRAPPASQTPAQGRDTSSAAREQGNQAFKSQNYIEAISAYSRCLSCTDKLTSLLH